MSSRLRALKSCSSGVDLIEYALLAAFAATVAALVFEWLSSSLTSTARNVTAAFLGVGSGPADTTPLIVSSTGPDAVVLIGITLGVLGIVARVTVSLISDLPWLDLGGAAKLFGSFLALCYSIKWYAVALRSGHDGPTLVLGVLTLVWISISTIYNSFKK